MGSRGGRKTRAPGAGAGVAVGERNPSAPRAVSASASVRAGATTAAPSRACADERLPRARAPTDRHRLRPVWSPLGEIPIAVVDDAQPSALVTRNVCRPERGTDYYGWCVSALRAACSPAISRRPSTVELSRSHSGSGLEGARRDPRDGIRPNRHIRYGNAANHSLRARG
jgi:hypothetical protein